MSRQEAIARALNAATRAGVITIWGFSGDSDRYVMSRRGTQYTLTPFDLLICLPRWVRATTPTDTASWQILLDRMEDLAETCRWWGVAP